jgi:hypothetical protein
MMRSYNHRWRPSHSKTYSTLNRGQIEQSTLKIWEACRATAAAPYFFRKILIDGYEYIDGGVGDNNPSTHAWNEAKELSKTNTGTNKVAMLVSLGTGMTEPYTKFGGLLGWVKYARKAITETTKAHENTRNFAHLVEADYFRFDVRPIRDVHDGLSKIKIDECKRKRKTQRKTCPETPSNASETSSGFQEQQLRPLPVPIPREDSTGEDSNENEELAIERERVLTDMDVHNDTDAAQPGAKDSYRPDRYEYTTFRDIKDLTDRYCLSKHYSFLREQGHHEAQNVRREIDQCARKLVEYSRRRRENDPERWRRFRRHPDPQHEANRANPPREA